MVLNALSDQTWEGVEDKGRGEGGVWGQERREEKEEKEEEKKEREEEGREKKSNKERKKEMEWKE